MGQEARCRAHVGDRISEGKALLETGELVFRGDFRLSISLKDVTLVEAADGRLRLEFPGGTATFELGSRAEHWAHQIRHPKRLIDKLGVKPDSRVAVLGVTDPEFWRQLRERATEVAEEIPSPESDFIFLQAETVGDLRQLLSLQDYLKRNGAIWVISPKKRPDIKDTDIIAAARHAGLVDTKVAAFSPTHTATKLVIPIARR